MLDRAIRLYFRSLARCLPLALSGTVLAAALGEYSSARIRALSTQYRQIIEDIAGGLGGELPSLSDLSAPLRPLWHSSAMWASLVGAALIVALFHGALIRRQYALISAAPGAHARSTLGQALSRLPSLLLLIGLLAAAVALAALALMAGAAVGLGSAVLLGLALLIAGSWVWGRLQLWLVALFTAELGAIAALRVSWRLVRGHWWEVSTIVSVAYLAIWLVQLIAQACAGVVIDIAHAGGASALLIGQAFAVLAGTLTLPVLPAVWLALYEQLQKKNPARGGVDFAQIAQVHQGGRST